MPWWRVIRQAPYTVTFVKSSERPGSKESGWLRLDGEPLDHFEFEEATEDEMKAWVTDWAKKFVSREPGPSGRLS